MKNALDNLSLDSISFSWGIELSQFAQTIPDKKIENFHRSIRFPCSEIIGVASIFGEARSPAIDRPVMQMTFELIDPGLSSIDNRTNYWLKAIKKIAGDPLDETRFTLPPYGDPSGCVVFNAKWFIGDVGLNLSVYGDNGNSDGCMSSAGLFFDWKNERNAAAPYIEEFTKLQSIVDDAVKNLKSMSVFQLGLPQVPYHMPDYESNDPHKARNDRLLRVAQKCLYKRKLLETPESIKTELDEESIAVWKCQGSQYWGLSTHYDSVLISDEEVIDIHFTNLLPAKGSGGMSLSVGDLSLSDRANSNEMKKLVKQLEENANRKIKCTQSYDC